jgi:hypothetical protein
MIGTDDLAILVAQANLEDAKFVNSVIELIPNKAKLEIIQSKLSVQIESDDAHAVSQILADQKVQIVATDVMQEIVENRLEALKTTFNQLVRLRDVMATRNENMKQVVDDDSGEKLLELVSWMLTNADSATQSATPGN